MIELAFGFLCRIPISEVFDDTTPNSICNKFNIEKSTKDGLVKSKEEEQDNIIKQSTTFGTDLTYVYCGKHTHF